MKYPSQPGALLDIRTHAEKERDYTFEETIASSAPVVWENKSPQQWRSFPIFDQNGSGSCVAQTLRKMLGIHIFNESGQYVDLSASHIYQRRINRPAPGMMGVDAFQIAQKGVTLEQFAPSNDMTDAQMDSLKVVKFMESVGEVFAIGNYMQITNRTIDQIASIIQSTGKGVMVWFYFSDGLTPREWNDVPTVRHPQLTVTGPNVARHSVTAVDFTLYQGKKALIIEDSWGMRHAMDGRRIITEEFFNARCYYAAHFQNFRFQGDSGVIPNRPRYTFNRDLEFTPTFTRDEDVVALQNILKFEGLFPVNIESSGYYGAITRTHVERFQVKHSIATPGTPGYGRVGPLTRQKLNSLYS